MTRMPRIPRWVFAFFLLMLAQVAVFAVTVIESTRTVQSKNFLIRWSGSDQEAIVSLQWDANGSPASAPNLTNSSNVGSCPAPFAPEYWGNSWTGGAPQNGEPVIVGMRTVTPEGGTAWSAAFGEKGSAIDSQSSECFPPYDAAAVPVRTRYRFYDNKPRGDVIRLDRSFEFDQQPLSVRFRPYIPRLSRSAGLAFDQVKYPNTTGSLTTVNVDLCPFGCTRPDFNGAAGWFAIHSPSTGKGVIVRRAADDNVPQLWMDWDGASFTNASSFILPPPPGGFTERFNEKMVLCFYNTATWTAAQQQALQLPAGCSVDGD